MNRLLAFAFIACQVFMVACSNSAVSRRQDNSTSSSSTSPASLNATMAQQGIPVQCYSNCTVPINQTINCLQASCECTNEYENGLYGCYLCTGTTLKQGFDAAQQKLDHLYQSCTRLGYQVAQLVFPGEEELITAGSFTPTTSSTTSTVTQSFTVHLQQTQDTGVNPQTTPDLSGANLPETSSNDGARIAKRVHGSFGLIMMLMGILALAY